MYGNYVVVATTKKLFPAKYDHNTIMKMTLLLSCRDEGAENGSRKSRGCREAAEGFPLVLVNIHAYASPMGWSVLQ